MPTNSTSEESRKVEWIGDAILRACMGLVVRNMRPHETAQGIAFAVQAFTTNKCLGEFAKHTGCAKGCNDFERQLGDLIICGYFSQVRLMCDALYDFASTREYEQNMKSHMITVNNRRQAGIKPEPCRCGSRNIRVHRKPMKIVCLDCERAFYPPTGATKDGMFHRWNMLSKPL